MNRWLSTILVGLILSQVAFATPEDDQPESGSVIGYAALLRRQLDNQSTNDVSPETYELRAQHVASQHAEAFSKLRERYSDEEIERAFNMLERARYETAFMYWINHSRFPGLMDPKHKDYLYSEMRRNLGTEFISGEEGQYVVNAKMIEMTVALTNGKLREIELVDILPSGVTKKEALERDLNWRRAHARELHETALASVLAHRSSAEVEAAFALLLEKYSTIELDSWIKYCYLRNTDGRQRDRRFRALHYYSDALGPAFVNEQDGAIEANPDMVEYTLALTDGDFDQLRLAHQLPSGKNAADVLRDARARRPKDIILHIRAHSEALGRRERVAEPLATILENLNSEFQVITFDLATKGKGALHNAATLTRELRAWLEGGPPRIGMVVVEGDGLGALTDVAAWSNRSVLEDALQPLRGHLGEDAQIVLASNKIVNDAKVIAVASRKLLDSLGAGAGSVVTFITRREYIPTFDTHYLAGARVATAGAVAGLTTALSGGATDLKQIAFAGLGVPLVYLAARPLYAMIGGGRLALDHRLDWAVAMGAGFLVATSQALAAGDVRAVAPAFGLGTLAFGLTSSAQYAVVTLPRLWKTHRGTLNTAIRFGFDKKGAETTEPLRGDRDRKRIYTCRSSLMSRASDSRTKLSVVR